MEGNIKAKLVEAIALSLVLAGCATVPTSPVAPECRGKFSDLSARFDMEFAEAQKTNWGAWGRRLQGRDGEMRPIDPMDSTSPLACAKREWLRNELAAVSCELRLEPCRGVEGSVLAP